jgi:hypothetical protein
VSNRDDHPRDCGNPSPLPLDRLLATAPCNSVDNENQSSDARDATKYLSEVHRVIVSHMTAFRATHCPRCGAPALPERTTCFCGAWMGVPALKQFQKPLIPTLR